MLQCGRDSSENPFCLRECAAWQKDCRGKPAREHGIVGWQGLPNFQQ